MVEKVLRGANAAGGGSAVFDRDSKRHPVAFQMSIFNINKRLHDTDLLILKHISWLASDHRRFEGLKWYRKGRTPKVNGSSILVGQNERPGAEAVILHVDTYVHTNVIRH